MSRFHLSEQARQDLEDVWLFIAEDNQAAADEVIDKIVSRFSTLADHPNMGRARDELAPLLRSFPIDNYVVFYRARRDGIDIVRILSGFRDLPALFP